MWTTKKNDNVKINKVKDLIFNFKSYLVSINLDNETIKDQSIEYSNELRFNMNCL